MGPAPAPVDSSAQDRPSEAPGGLPRMRAAVGGLRTRLERSAATRWLVGGEDEATAQTLWQGLIGALLTLIGSWGVGWLATTPQSIFARQTVLNPLRVEPLGVVVCAILLILGSLLLVRAWLRLGQRLAGRRTDSTPVVVRATWLWSAPLLLAFPVFSRDVYSYLAQGRQLHVGLNPYEEGVSALPGWFMQGADSIWAESPSPYGPLFLMMAQGIWVVSGGVPELAVLLFRLLSVGGMALCLWAIPRLATRFGSTPSWATWICVTNPLFLLYMIAGVHNDAVMIGLLLVGLVMLDPAAERGRQLTGLMMVVLSVAIKPLTLLALPFAALLVLYPSRGDVSTGAPPWAAARSTPALGARIRLWAVAVVVAALVLIAVGAASGLWFGWVPAMLTSGDAAFPYAPFGLLGLGIGWVVDAVAGTGVRPVADVVYSLGKVVTAALTAWLALTHRAINPVLSTSLVLLAAVLLAPIVQPWYLLWVLPLFAVVRRWRGWPIWVLYLLVLALVVVGVVDQISVAQWIPQGWVRLSTALVGIAYMVFLVFLDPKTSALFPFPTQTRRRRRSRADRAAPSDHSQEAP